MSLQSFIEKYKIVDQFNTSYWSGSDVDVLINNTLIDESTQCSWQIMNRVQPFYNYAAYVPTNFKHGTRLISGELTINFKQVGYFYSVIQHLNQNASPVDPIQEFNTPSNANSLLTGVNSNTSAAIKSYIKAYEKELEANNRVIDQIINTPATIPNFKGMFESNNPLNIKIVFGGHVDQSVILKYASGNSFIEKDAIYRAGANSAPFTGLELMDVHVMGNATVIDDSGRPIMETFSFMAGNIRPITNRE